MQTRMLHLIDIYEGNLENVGSRGEVLFHRDMAKLEAHQIPLSNLVGFAADGASNVMGLFNSLSSRLKETLPGITIFKCICHSIHLCSSEAAKTLPRQCEDIVHNIYTHFAHPAERLKTFKQFRGIFYLKPHHTPCMSNTLALISQCS